MKQQFTEKIKMPEGVSCEFKGRELICKKGPSELKKLVSALGVAIKIEGNEIVLHCKAGNRADNNKLMTYAAHLNNLLSGLDEVYTYKLEACNVHFPMSLKLEPTRLVINNFLGEKVPRYSKILPNVKVEVKGTSITVTSSDKESAGQTAANMEKATKVRYRDRRVFQDGIFIVEKGGAK